MKEKKNVRSHVANSDFGVMEAYQGFGRVKSYIL